jgi:hypothetical protein
MLNVPSQQPTLTAADMNAVIASNTALVTILEAMRSDAKQSLTALQDIKTECTATKDILKHSLVENFVQEGVVKKGLDISNDESKLSKGIAEQTTLLTQIIELVKVTIELIKKAMFVTVLVVTILGGIQGIKWFFFGPAKQAPAVMLPEVHWEGENSFIINGADTLWVSGQKYNTDGIGYPLVKWDGPYGYYYNRAGEKMWLSSEKPGP